MGDRCIAENGDWGFLVLLNGLQLFAGEFMFGSAWEKRRVEKYTEAERQLELLSH